MQREKTRQYVSHGSNHSEPPRLLLGALAAQSLPTEHGRCVCCKAGRLEIAAVAEPTMSGVGMQPAAVPVTYAQPVEGVPVKGGNAV